MRQHKYYPSEKVRAGRGVGPRCRRRPTAIFALHPQHQRVVMHLLGSRDGYSVGREGTRRWTRGCPQRALQRLPNTARRAEFLASVTQLVTRAERVGAAPADDGGLQQPFTTGFSAEPVAVHTFSQVGRRNGTLLGGTLPIQPLLALTRRHQIVAGEVRLDQYRTILLEEPGFSLHLAFEAVAAPNARVISAADVEVCPPPLGRGGCCLGADHCRSPVQAFLVSTHCQADFEAVLARGALARCVLPRPPLRHWAPCALTQVAPADSPATGGPLSASALSPPSVRARLRPGAGAPSTAQC